MSDYEDEMDVDVQKNPDSDIQFSSSNTGNKGKRSAANLPVEIEDNLQVGAQDPMNLVEIARRLDTRGIDAVVLSACVQMPSLGAVATVEQACGLPVVTASICTAFQMLDRLGLKAVSPGAGALMSGRYGRAASRVGQEAAE